MFSQMGGLFEKKVLRRSLPRANMGSSDETKGAVMNVMSANEIQSIVKSLKFLYDYELVTIDVRKADVFESVKFSCFGGGELKASISVHRNIATLVDTVMVTDDKGRKVWTYSFDSNDVELLANVNECVFVGLADLL